jgi:hypothetical protein
MSIAALVAGVRGVTLLGQADYQRRPDRNALMAAAIVGIVLAGLTMSAQLLGVLGLIGGALRRH